MLTGVHVYENGNMILDFNMAFIANFYRAVYVVLREREISFNTLIDCCI